MSIEVAPYEVASSIDALPKGKYLYYHGKKYLRPVLSPEQQLELIADIRRALGICDESCTGIKRFMHEHVTRKHHL